MVLIEHQSTLNPNMALRLLLYVARILEKMVKGKSLYVKKRIAIPWPEFYVLYNGADPYPDAATLRLSDLFERPQDLGFPEKLNPLLELEVKVFNINEGRNALMAQHCRKLADYSAFIAKARTYLGEWGNQEEAIRETVKYCQKHDILSEFLEKNAREVSNMLLTEWNMDDAIAVTREEALEEGLERGRVEGRQYEREESRNYFLELINQGLSLDEIKARLTQTC